MLVSLMTSFRTIAMRNTASLSMMRTSDAMMKSLGNINPYNVNFQSLHQQDCFNSSNMITSQLQYKIALAMEKQSKELLMQEAERNKSLDVIA